MRHLTVKAIPQCIGVKCTCRKHSCNSMQESWAGTTTIHRCLIGNRNVLWENMTDVTYAWLFSFYDSNIGPTCKGHCINCHCFCIRQKRLYFFLTLISGSAECTGNYIPRVRLLLIYERLFVISSGTRLRDHLVWHAAKVVAQLNNCLFLHGLVYI